MTNMPPVNFYLQKPLKGIIPFHRFLDVNTIGYNCAYNSSILPIEFATCAQIAIRSSRLLVIDPKRSFKDYG
jgi:hypothetical protein